MASPVEKALEQLKDISVTKEDREYKKAIKIYNPEYLNLQPYFVVIVHCIEDIQKSLKVATATGTPVAIKSGGHSFGGYSTIGNDGFIISLEKLNNVYVNDSDVVVEAGARWIDVYRALDGTGYITVGGSCTSIGLSGFVLGGGFGLQSRYKGGLACDNSISFTMITADGQRVVKASAIENADLYWALRGGGGANFGVVVDITMNLHHSPKMFYWDVLNFYGNKNVEATLKHIGEHMNSFPNELNLDLIVKKGTLQLHAVYTDINKDEVLYTLSLFKPDSITQPKLPTDNFLEFITTYSDIHGDIKCGRYPVYIKGAFVQSLSPRLVSTLSALDIPKGIYINMVHLGGDITNILPTDSAFVHRDAQYIYYTYGCYNNHSQKQTVLRFSEYIYKVFKKSGCSKGCYVNYMDRHLQNWQQEYYGSNYNQLCKTKEKWNPVGKGVMHFPQEIGSKYQPILPSSRTRILYILLISFICVVSYYIGLVIYYYK